MDWKKIKQCSKCENFDRLYTKWDDSIEIEVLKGSYCTTKYGICEYKDKVVRSTYICGKYKERGKNDNKNTDDV